MNLLGIIAEYNPFHNGHKIHIEKSLADLKPDALVAVMSGNFTQRGNIACFDKWTRAKSALLNGVDLVIELPVTFASASAERFACGSIYLLDKIGVKNISFGTEDELKILEDIAEKLNSPDFRIQGDSDVPYHIARQHSVGDSAILNKPNNILAVEYLKALKNFNSDIMPHRIKRFGANYHEMEIIENTASATKVREILSESGDLSQVVPRNLIEIYKYTHYANENDFYSQLQYSIVSKTPEELASFAHVREGIENRIYKYAFKSKTFDELVKNIKTKRYTYTSISRMLISILLGIKKENLPEVPQYIRVLGLNNQGAKVLKYIEKHCELPIINKVANAHKILPEHAFAEFEIDLKASDIFSAVSGASTIGRPDFTTSPVKI